MWLLYLPYCFPFCLPLTMSLRTARILQTVYRHTERGVYQTLRYFEHHVNTWHQMLGQSSGHEEYVTRMKSSSNWGHFVPFVWTWRSVVKTHTQRSAVTQQHIFSPSIFSSCLWEPYFFLIVFQNTMPKLYIALVWKKKARQWQSSLLQLLSSLPQGASFTIWVDQWRQKTILQLRGELAFLSFAGCSRLKWSVIIKISGDAFLFFNQLYLIQGKHRFAIVVLCEREQCKNAVVFWGNIWKLQRLSNRRQF